MDWTEAVDGYCERLGPGLWAEPLNAVTNLAFIAGALWLWPRVRGNAPARALAAILGLIGIGSGLFHTVAERWAGLADVLPILMFILTYLWAVNARVLRLGPGAALAGAALFLPYAAVAAWAFGAAMPWLGSSAGYAPVALLIALYALGLWRRRPGFARALAVGAGVLALSIAARAADQPLCPLWPAGTHFLWHLLNAGMLTWMVIAYARATAAPPRAAA